MKAWGKIFPAELLFFSPFHDVTSKFSDEGRRCCGFLSTVGQAPVDSVAYWQFSKLERDAAAVTTARQHRSNSLLSNNSGGAPHTSRWPSFPLMLSLRIWPPSLWSSSFVHDNVQVVNMQGARGRCSLSRSIYTSSAFVATQPRRWTLVQLCDHAAECR